MHLHLHQQTSNLVVVLLCSFEQFSAEVQILCTFVLLEETSHIRVVAIFVIFNVRTMFIYGLQTYLRCIGVPNFTYDSSNSGTFVMKMNANQIFRLCFHSIKDT